jgi:hypothetical protein
LYLEIFGHARKLYKNIKNQVTRSNWSKVWPHQCHLTNPWEMAKKHTRNPSPLLIPTRCVTNGRKEASHGLLTHHLVRQVLKWTNGVHTHTLLHPKGSHTEGGGPQQWGASRCPTYAAWCPSVTRSPLLWTRARKHTWEQSYALIYGGSRLVWSKGKERMSRRSLMWRWSNPYSTLGYK